MSHGFGSTKQPESCIARNFAAEEVSCAELMSKNLMRLQLKREFVESKRAAYGRSPLSLQGRGANNSKVRAGADVLVSHTSRNDNHIAGMHLNGFAMLATESQGRCAAISSKHLMRGAVIMSKGIDAVSPRIAPIIL